MTSTAVGFDSGLSPTLIKALQESYNITEPTPIQAEAIPVLLQNCGDVVMQAQTGSGKTVAYVLPLLNMILGTFKNDDASGSNSSNFREEVGTVGIIIVPTRELAAQTQATLTKLLSRVRPHWIVATALTGGDSRKSEKARLRRGCQIVVGTPGRLLDHLKTSEGWKRSKLSWLIIDEADRLADLGFENTIKDIFSSLSMAMSRLRMVLVSATVTEKLKVEFAGRKLKTPQFIKAGPKKEIYNESVSNKSKSQSQSQQDQENSDQPETKQEMEHEFNAPVAIDQTYLHTPTKLRLQILVGLLRSFFPLSGTSQNCRVIVFFTCCDSVDFHFDLFKAASENKTIPAFLPPRVKLLRLHGNLDQSARISTFNEFIKEGKSTETVHTVLFCTDVAARGLDFPNLAGSVQYDAPCDIHDYIHRAGRTGRLSSSAVNPSAIPTKAKSVIFLMPSEEGYIQRLTNMGMNSLHKESFDDYLKWVEKLDAKKLQSLIAVKKSYQKKREEDSGDSVEEAIVAALPSTLKSRLGLLQRVIESGIAGNEELSGKARDGFLSTCRAYATHPSAEKDIFHIKRLHLGHLAAAFGLDREPKRMMDGARKNSKFPSKSADNRDQIPDEIAQGSSKMRKEMRDRQKYAKADEPSQFNNRLNFNSNTQKRLSSSKLPAPKKAQQEVYEDSDEGEVVFAY